MLSKTNDFNQQSKFKIMQLMPKIILSLILLVSFQSILGQNNKSKIAETDVF